MLGFVIASILISSSIFSGFSTGLVQAELGLIYDSSNFGSSGTSNPITLASTIFPTTAPSTNNGPVALDQSISTRSSPVEITIKATDQNQHANLRAQIVTEPQHGTLSAIDQRTGTLTYSPQSFFIGDDSFTFKVNDGIADSNTATIHISVIPITGGNPSGSGFSTGYGPGVTSNSGAASAGAVASGAASSRGISDHGANNSNTTTSQLPARNGTSLTYNQLIPVPGTSGLNVNMVITPIINGPNYSNKNVSNFKLTHDSGNTSATDISFIVGFDKLPSQVQQQLLAANPSISGGNIINSTAAGNATTPFPSSTTPTSYTTLKTKTMETVLETDVPSHITPIYLSDTIKGILVKSNVWYDRVDKVSDGFEAAHMLGEVGARAHQLKQAYSCLDSLTSEQLDQESKIQRLSELNDLNQRLADAQWAKAKIFILGIAGKLPAAIFSATNVVHDANAELDAEADAVVSEAMSVAGCKDTKTSFTILFEGVQAKIPPDGWVKGMSSTFTVLFPTIGSTTTSGTGKGILYAGGALGIGEGTQSTACIYGPTSIAKYPPYTFSFSAGKFGGKLSIVIENPTPTTLIAQLTRQMVGPLQCPPVYSDAQLDINALGCNQITIDLAVGKYNNGYTGVNSPPGCYAFIIASK